MRTELKIVDDPPDTLRRIDVHPSICPALEGAIVKLGALEEQLARIDSNLALTNESVRHLTVAIEELTSAIRRK